MAEVQIPPPTIDGIFRVHYKEVMRYPIRVNHHRKCSDCGFHGRMRSLASTQSIVRKLSAASIVNKDGAYQCKKHAPTGCSQCYGWKKQITKARPAAKKASRK